MNRDNQRERDGGDHASCNNGLTDVSREENAHK